MLTTSQWAGKATYQPMIPAVLPRSVCLQHGLAAGLTTLRFIDQAPAFRRIAHPSVRTDWAVESSSVNVSTQPCLSH